ncbi:MupA/Atu3671 family FMN-dependent luciferase-like monooxygenase [Actinomadura oligospora]|uniref:MupA/Atu3671 family FMN-dependent luciferase-like monooxygenase n=1 Tax=Actinomadura oligospora TaxID=111804 RepID=UPI0004BAA632|nr:MupA/Atu3671 family FMN-dependent luciferase-like monooxygenase [Actinomadura oligospora]
MVSVSLAYFAAGGPADPSAGPYAVLLGTARLADEAGLEAVWLPERHFGDFGSPFPNPAVPAAAVAATTRHVGIRAGSVVLPLHHPARVAEEWAVVDRLSGGRAGVSFASGWHGADFVLSRFDADERRRVMRDGIDAVRALWRGDPWTFEDASGRPVEVRTQPRPAQPELPMWITSGGSVGTFELAGTLRAGLLTHLVGQTPGELREKIAAYRKTRSEHGDGRGHVTLMLHTHVHDGSRAAADRAERELARYLTSSMRLDVSNVAAASDAAAVGGLGDADRGAIAAAGAARYVRGGLVCAAGDVQERLAEVASWDVDEVACLIDFGFDHGAILAGVDALLSVLA